MKIKNFIKKVKSRFKDDGILVFGYRILFFLFRIFLGIYDHILFKILKLKLWSKGKFIIKNIHGSQMCLDVNDPGISKDLILADTREPAHTELMKNILKSGDTIIDIGANIGYYALLESKIVGKTGKVYAIEPVKRNIDLLKKNILLNNYKNIETFEAAVSRENKTKNMYLTTKSNWCTLRLSKNDKIDEQVVDKVLVKTITLDKFVEDKKFPNLIRMDVEGYEIEIIKGMKNILAEKKSLKIIIELHCCFLSDLGFDMLRELEKNGFKIRLFFRDCSSLMLNKSKLIKKIYYYLGKKINGVYEFIYKDIDVKELEVMKNILEKETFHIYLERK